MLLEHELQPSTAEMVEVEIAAQNRKDKAENLANFLNNFPNKLPGSAGMSIDEIFRERNWGHLDSGKFKDTRQRYCDLWRGEGETEEQFVQSERKAGHSDKRIFGSEQQFKEDIQIAIEQSGVDKDTLVQYIDAHIKSGIGPAGDSRKDHELVRQLILPVYTKLREMGYSHADMYS